MYYLTIKILCYGILKHTIGDKSVSIISFICLLIYCILNDYDNENLWCRYITEYIVKLCKINTFIMLHLKSKILLRW